MKFNDIEPRNKQVRFPEGVTVNGHSTALSRVDGTYNGRHTFNGLFEFPTGECMATLRCYGNINNRHAVSSATAGSVEPMLYSQLKANEWARPDGGRFVKSRMVMTQARSDEELDSSTRPFKAFAVWVDHELGVALPITDRYDTAFGTSNIRYEDFNDNTKLPTSTGRFWPVEYDKKADTGLAPFDKWLEAFMDFADTGQVFLSMAGEAVQQQKWYGLPMPITHIKHYLENGKLNPRPWLGSLNANKQIHKHNVTLQDVTGQQTYNVRSAFGLVAPAIGNLGLTTEIDPPLAYMLAAYVKFYRDTAAAVTEQDFAAQLKAMYRALEAPRQVKVTNPITHLVKKV